MIQSGHWTIALAVALLIGVAGTLYFRLVVMRRDETSAGLSLLASMSWREFIHLVLDALAHQGYSRVVTREAPAGDDQFILERNGALHLLSCKHGSAFVLGNPAVIELNSKMRLASADAGILATQGRIDEQSRPLAKQHHIQLLDGPTLWPELRNLVGAEQVQAIQSGAARKARQRIILSWVLALLAALAVLLLLPGGKGQDGTTADQANLQSNTSASQPAQVDKPQPSIAAPAANDEASLQAQRDSIAQSVSTLPEVDRAVWSTQSTLQVFLVDADIDAKTDVCPLLVRYEALASSRLQLTPPQGSDLPTRFMQCRSY